MYQDAPTTFQGVVDESICFWEENNYVLSVTLQLEPRCAPYISTYLMAVVSKDNFLDDYV